jgi:vancomycin resistance protein YoaR
VFKNKPVLLLLGAIGVFVIIILSCIIYISVAWKGKIVPGVQVEWIEVGGLTQDEAEQKISEVQQEFLSAPVEITASEERVSLSRGELGFSIDAKKPAQQAYQVGREGSISKRISQTWYAYHKQVVIPCPEVMIDTQQVESILASFSEGLDEPQDARLIIDDRDQITIIPSKTGIAVDLDVSLDDLKLFKQPFAGEIELQYKEELPKVSTADIEAMGINGIISSFTTKFDASNYNRSYNIALAAKALNNTLIKPGEVFSFNKRVGPRTAKSGYREAIIIESNVFVPGLGGGVCQVSSTLYNTVLLAGLEITERSNHSLAITYVPLGRDAAVSYGYQDLKFRNNLKSHIYIKTYVGKGSLTMKIFGNTQQRKNVSLETVVNSVINPKVTTKDDPNLLKGKTVVEKAGAKGYRVTAYRIINGSKQLLSQNYYRPTDQVVRVGTKEPSAEPRPNRAHPVGSVLYTPHTPHTRGQYAAASSPC